MIEALKELFVVLTYTAGILILAVLICGIAIGLIRYFMGRK